MAGWRKFFVPVRSRGPRLPSGPALYASFVTPPPSAHSQHAPALGLVKVVRPLASLRALHLDQRLRPGASSIKTPLTTAARTGNDVKYHASRLRRTRRRRRRSRPPRQPGRGVRERVPDTALRGDRRARTKRRSSRARTLKDARCPTSLSGRTAPGRSIGGASSKCR